MSYGLLDDLLVDPTRQIHARQRLRDTVDGAPTIMTYMRWRPRLPPCESARRVVFASSFTLATLEPFLEVESYIAGWRMRPEFAPYSQWLNALVAPANPETLDAVYVVLDMESLLGAREAEVARPRDLIFDAVQRFRELCGAPVLLCLLEPPVSSAQVLGNPHAHNMRREATRELLTMTEQLASTIDSVYAIDAAVWCSEIGQRWFDFQSMHTSMSPVARHAMGSFARLLARAAAPFFRPRAKVLALDLDNTVWGGIVGEDGEAGLHIGPETWPGAAYHALQQHCCRLRDSGVLLAVNSKNNEADVRAVFANRKDMLLTWEDFSAHRVNWENKAANIESIAAELGLGVDSVVFADDSPQECALVRELLPEVEVVELGDDPREKLGKLLRCSALDTLAISDEDRGRAQSYKAERVRQTQRASAANVEEFLGTLDLQLEIAPLDEMTRKRARQLLGKTNQFNLSLRRPTEAELQAHAPEFITAKLSDRFGDYGVIGVMRIRRVADVFEILDFVLSCRALGRGVEQALLSFVVQQARSQGCEQVRAVFVKGPRNQQVPTCLEGCGFINTQSTHYGFNLACELGAPPYLCISSPAVSSCTGVPEQYVK
jgi:FkbH-like protein